MEKYPRSWDIISYMSGIKRKLTKSAKKVAFLNQKIIIMNLYKEYEQKKI